jgi:hypothetical protein
MHSKAASSLAEFFGKIQLGVKRRASANLNEAAVMLVQLLENAKKFNPARRAREQFIKQYAVPPEVFSPNSKAVR